jgi:hypothetical protein
MVSRRDFQSGLNAARITTLGIVTPSKGLPDKPNIQVRKMNGEPDASLAQRLRHLKGRFTGYGTFAAHPGPVRSAVRAAQDSYERRLARALESAPALTAESLVMGVAEANAILDGKEFPSSNRFGLLSTGAWVKALGNPEFANSPSVLGEHSRVWSHMIWLRHPYLEVQAVLFHKSAIEGRIEPFDATPGQSASAFVEARLVNPDGARVLHYTA